MTQTVFTLTENHTLRYRYTCESCSKTTEWFSENLPIVSSITLDGRNDISDLTSEQIQGLYKELDSRREPFFEDILDLRHNMTTGKLKKKDFDWIESNFNGKSCPKCGKSQSWHISFDPGCLFVCILLAIMVLGLFFGFIGVVVTPDSVSGIVCNTLFAISMVVNAIILIFIGIKKILARKAYKTKCPYKDVLEIEWPKRNNASKAELSENNA